MSSFVVPGKFVYCHQPRTGGGWLTKNVSSQTEIIELGAHTPFDRVPGEYKKLARVSIVRESADWLQSLFDYWQLNGWDEDSTIAKTSRADNVEYFATNLIKNHPRILQTYIADYSDGSDFVIDQSELIDQSRVVLDNFGLSIVDCGLVNSVPRSKSMSICARDEWRCHNADLADRFGWQLPDDSPVYSLPDWSVWFLKTCEYLQSRFLGKHCQFLELGTCEGRGTIAAIKTLLRHSESCVDSVDIWSLSPRHRAEKNIALSISRDRFRLFDDFSELLLGKGMKQYDVVYIDADRTREGCLADFRNAWRLLKPGGFMVIDDYGCEQWPSAWPGVKIAVDEVFSRTICTEHRVPGNDYQKVFQKC